MDVMIDLNVVAVLITGCVYAGVCCLNIIIFRLISNMKRS